MRSACGFGTSSRRDDGRPHRRERVAGLTALPLFVGELQVARAHVVEIRVSEDVVEGAIFETCLAGVR